MATLTGLDERHHSSLYDICLSGIAPKKGNHPATFKDLDTLCISTLPSSQGFAWPCELLYSNRDSLRQVQLGVETAMAKAYAIRPITHLDLDVTSSLKSSLEARSANPGSKDPIFDLDLLWLCGIDLNSLMRVEERTLVNLSTLGSLALESCPEMNGVFGFLKNQMMRLKTFALRYESSQDGLLVDLFDFLRSFEGLECLQVLLEGAGPGTQQLSQVLSIHGKTLKTLVWDERIGPRDTTARSKTLLPGRTGHLQAIAAHCPRLTSLGMCLNWQSITSETKHEVKVKVNSQPQ